MKVEWKDDESNLEEVVSKSITHAWRVKPECCEKPSVHIYAHRHNRTLGKSNELLFMTYHSVLTNPLTYVRFFTHVLGHSGWEHYIGNAAYILLLGPMLEEKYGSKKILWVILITALVTGLMNYILFPNEALCGASGVVFLFILLTSFTSFKNGEIPLTSILVAVIFLGQLVYEGVFLQDNISNLSHVMGGIIGSIVGYKLNKR